MKNPTNNPGRYLLASIATIVLVILQTFVSKGQEAPYKIMVRNAGVFETSPAFLYNSNGQSLMASLVYTNDKWSVLFNYHDSNTNAADRVVLHTKFILLSLQNDTSIPFKIMDLHEENTSTGYNCMMLTEPVFLTQPYLNNGFWRNLLANNQLRCILFSVSTADDTFKTQKYFNLIDPGYFTVMVPFLETYIKKGSTANISFTADLPPGATQTNNGFISNSAQINAATENADCKVEILDNGLYLAYHAALFTQNDQELNSFITYGAQQKWSIGFHFKATEGDTNNYIKNNTKLTFTLADDKVLSFNVNIKAPDKEGNAILFFDLSPNPDQAIIEQLSKSPIKVITIIRNGKKNNYTDLTNSDYFIKNIACVKSKMAETKAISKTNTSATPSHKAKPCVMDTKDIDAGELKTKTETISRFKNDSIALSLYNTGDNLLISLIYYQGAGSTFKPQYALETASAFGFTHADSSGAYFTVMHVASKKITGGTAYVYILNPNQLFPNWKETLQADKPITDFDFIGTDNYSTKFPISYKYYFTDRLPCVENN